jgi:hypothetical protein
MQTLGRVAIIGGGIIVALVNVVMFRNVEALPEADKIAIYVDIYRMALTIPAISVLGVALAAWLKRRDRRRLRGRGFRHEEVQAMLEVQDEPPAPNWWILGGGLAFVLFTLTLGLTDVPYNQEITFFGSLGIVVFLMSRLVRVLDPEDRRVLVGTALVIFVFRALPGPGAGATWWMIDELGFDQQFLSQLSLIGSVLTLFGMFIFRRFMAERSIAYVIGFLTIASTILSLPILGMYYGLHHWTAAHTGGLVDARFIAVIDTALESPLGQIAMIPMLAWIARTAPVDLKATFFAVMASFTNLALSLSQLGTKHLNELFLVTREVRDAATGVLAIPANYSALGTLLITVTILGLVLPFLAILFVKFTRFRSA